MRNKRLDIVTALAFLSLLGLAGCDEGAMEKSGEKVDEAVEETGDAIEDAADEIEDATDPD
jgi:hypothetical protein